MMATLYFYLGLAFTMIEKLMLKDPDWWFHVVLK